MKRTTKWLLILSIVFMSINTQNTFAQNPLNSEDSNTNPHDNLTNNPDPHQEPDSYEDEDIIPPQFNEKEMGFTSKAKKLKKKLYLPENVKIKPHKISIPLGYDLSFVDEAIQQDKIDLYQLTPSLLTTLTSTDLNKLLDFLGSQKVYVKWKDTNNGTRSGKISLKPHRICWDYSNAATALAISIVAHDDFPLFVTLLTTRPDLILPKLKHKTTGLLTSHVVANALVRMVENLDSENSAHISLAASQMVYQYIHYWGSKNPKRFTYMLEHLTTTTFGLMREHNTLTAQQIGLIIGSIISGIHKHTHKIKKTDERRQLIVISTLTMIRSSTSFLGAVPWFAGNIASLAAGTISVSTTSAMIFYNFKFQPRDYSSAALHIAGQIKLAILKHSHEHNQKNIGTMIDWMTAYINLNGYGC